MRQHFTRGNSEEFIQVNMKMRLWLRAGITVLFIKARLLFTIAFLGGGFKCIGKRTLYIAKLPGILGKRKNADKQYGR